MDTLHKDIETLLEIIVRSNEAEGQDIDDLPNDVHFIASRYGVKLYEI